MRSLETTAVHVVGEDGLEARPMSVEEVFLSLGVVERTSFVVVAEQRVWMTCEHLTAELVVQPAHVHAYSIAVVRSTVLSVSKLMSKFTTLHTTHANVGTLAVWLSGNALALINVVALRQTRLVPGWVTVYGRVNHFGM